MINLLLGQPGGGKSYEAVAYHLIPAIEEGRKVITNLPLNLDYFRAVYGAKLVSELIELRHKTVASPIPFDWEKAEGMFKRFGIVPRPFHFIDRVFSNLVDYDNAWRHPETRAGVLYIIDECHFCLPSKNTQIEVEEWYSMHRHESADVLLITQSYGKVSKAIIDLVQVVYRVKKATAFGTNKSYIRKVFDGVRGSEVNFEIRTYDPKYFNFYQSHTKGGGSELAANDIVPIWKKWQFVGAAIMFTIFLMMLFSGTLKNPLKPKITPITPVPIVSTPVEPKPIFAPVPSQTPVVPVAPVPTTVAVAAATDPLNAFGIHIVGHLFGKGKDFWILALSQNGQRLKNINPIELTKIGYLFEPKSDCGAWLTYEKQKRFITCDSPSIQLVSASSLKK